MLPGDFGDLLRVSSPVRDDILILSYCCWFLSAVSIAPFSSCLDSKFLKIWIVSSRNVWWCCWRWRWPYRLPLHKEDVQFPVDLECPIDFFLAHYNRAFLFLRFLHLWHSSFLCWNLEKKLREEFEEDSVGWREEEDSRQQVIAMNEGTEGDILL